MSPFCFHRRMSVARFSFEVPRGIFQQNSAEESKSDRFYKEGFVGFYFGQGNLDHVDSGLGPSSEERLANGGVKGPKQRLEDLHNKRERNQLRDKVPRLPGNPRNPERGKGRPFPEPTPRELDEKDKDIFDQRILDDFFDGDEEKYKEYLEGVGDAIEKLNPDDLHRFVKERPEYGQGGYETWGKDFINEILLPNLPENLKVEPEDAEEKAKWQKCLIVMTQSFLVGYFERDVFQLFTEKEKNIRINPFIKIDGKLGGYSISVLAAFWNTKYGAASKLDPNPLGYASLEKEYGVRGGNKAIFDNALAWLDAQITGKTPEKKTEEGAPEQVASEKPIEEKDEKGEEKKAEAPSTGQESEEVAEMGPPPLPEAEVVEKEKAIPKLHPKIEEAVQAAVESYATMRRNIITGRTDDEYVEVRSDLDVMRDHGPDSLRFINSIEGKGPKEAFDLYEKAYEEWEEAQSDLSGYKEAEKLRDEAFAVLEKAVEAYYHRLDDADKGLTAKYEEGLREIVAKYDFPTGKINPDDKVEGVDFNRLKSNSEAGGAQYLRRHHMPLLNFGLLLNKYFLSTPVRVATDKKDLLVHMKGSTQEEREESLEKALIMVQERGGDGLKTINDWIYLGNYHAFNKEHNQLIQRLEKQADQEKEGVQEMSLSILVAGESSAEVDTPEKPKS